MTTKHDDGGPAFPQSHPEHPTPTDGQSLRDYFAQHATPRPEWFAFPPPVFPPETNAGRSCDWPATCDGSSECVARREMCVVRAGINDEWMIQREAAWAFTWAAAMIAEKRRREGA